MELYNKYRPSNFEEVSGNEDAIKSLRSELQNGTHTFMLTGPAGCGKSTLAYIMAKEVGADDLSTHIINSSSMTGIDTVREIEKQVTMAPLTGNASVYILDECFKEGTLVEAELGPLPIETLKSGDFVFTSDGLHKLKKLKKNKIGLDRICIIHYNSGERLITTVDHKFFTSRGWVEAKNLKPEDVLYERKQSKISENLCNLQSGILRETSKRECLSKSELQERGGEAELKENDSSSEMSSLQKRVSNKNRHLLQYEMCENSETISSNDIRAQGTFETECSSLSSNRERKTACDEEFRIDEKEQSIKQSGCCEKSDRNEEKERNSRHPEVQSGREWSLRSSSDDVVQYSERSDSSSAGTSNQNVCETRQNSEYAEQLQSRSCDSGSETSYRSGRIGPSDEEGQPIGFEKNCQVATTRVESIEIFEPRCLEQPGWDWLTDNERSSGFAFFFDLEVDQVHNYFANGILVHNCHMNSASSQNALLKVLEDCPEYVYFFLCTTDPQKLIKALQTRCSMVAVKPLKQEQMVLLLRKVCHKEGIKVAIDVLEDISEASEGSGRRALKLLASVIYLENDEERRKYLQDNSKVDENPDAIQLARVLAKGAQWNEIASALSKVDLSNAEGVRQLLMSYANTILLKGSNPQAMCMMMAFSQADTYRNGKFAITQGCLDYLQMMGS